MALFWCSLDNVVVIENKQFLHQRWLQKYGVTHGTTAADWIGPDLTAQELTPYFGPDDEQTCIIVTLTDAAKQDPRALVGRGILGKRRGTLLDIAERAGVQPPQPPP